MTSSNQPQLTVSNSHSTYDIVMYLPSTVRLYAEQCKWESISRYTSGYSDAIHTRARGLSIPRRECRVV